MKPVIFIPDDAEKAQAGAQATEILNALTKCSEEVLFQAYVLQIVLECFEGQYNINIRDGFSVSNDDRFRPKPKG